MHEPSSHGTPRPEVLEGAAVRRPLADPARDAPGAGRRETQTTTPLNVRNVETAPEALGPLLTPTRGFFIRSHLPAPQLRASTWRFSVGGAVAEPRKWTLPELAALPQTRLVATLECAGNSRRRLPTAAPGELRWGDHAVGSAVWEGVLLGRLLEEARPLPGAREVVFRGAETGAPSSAVQGFSRSLAVDLAAGGEPVLVATKMNGEPLPPDHGWPARLVVPGWYGMAWVKWLAAATVRRTPFRGYYQASRYVYQYERDGRRLVEPVTRLRVKSLILSPTEGAPLTLGQAYVVSGRAWGGHGPVVRVEVDVGTGWEPAALHPGDGPHDWSSWEFPWTPGRSGACRLRVRATDARGETQPEQPFLNDFQYGTNTIHSVEVRVR